MPTSLLFYLIMYPFPESMSIAVSRANGSGKPFGYINYSVKKMKCLKTHGKSAVLERNIPAFVRINGESTAIYQLSTRIAINIRFRIPGS